MRFIPHDYQGSTLDWMFGQVLERGLRGGLLFQEPGLGKTVTTLTWFNGLVKCGLAKKMLVVAPVRVRDNVWPQEPLIWDHLCDRMHVQTIGSGKWKDLPDTNVAVINPESLSGFQKWAKRNNFHPDVVVVDESGDFRNWTSRRTRMLKKIIKASRWRFCLTATPVPESAVDIFPQAWFIDEGETLGKNITAFRKDHCYQGGHNGRKWLIHRGESDVVAQKISHLCLYGTVEDNLDLPPVKHELHIAELGDKAREMYKNLENKKKEELWLPDGTLVVPRNAGAKRNLLRQICAGGVYDDKNKVHEIHTSKVDMLQELTSTIDTPVMVAYQYEHDLGRIQKVFPDIEVIKGKSTPKQVETIIRMWNRSEVPMLAVQPQALSHGVNMQKGTCQDVIWFTLPDSLLVFMQLNTRVHRQGVMYPVTIHEFVTRATVDRSMSATLARKTTTQAQFLNLLPRIIGPNVKQPDPPRYEEGTDECIF